MNSTKITFALVPMMLFGLLFSCKNNDPIIDPDQTPVPAIRFAYDQSLAADLNKVDNLPVVAVITSAAGLQSVEMEIEHKSGVVHYKSVSSFFNTKSYSLAEKLTFQNDYIAFIVKAKDLLGRVTESRLPFSLTELKESPKVVFDPAKIVYDELVGGTMPTTHYTVTTNAALKKVEMFKVHGSSQIQYGFPIEFTNGEQSYEFTQLINYVEGDRGFKVKVTDIYGQVSIETLPVEYKAVPPPTITLKRDTIFADKNESKEVEFNIASHGGVASIKIYRVEGVGETLVKSLAQSGETQLSVKEAITFTNATGKLRIEVTDRIGKSSKAEMTAMVNLRFISGLEIGSHPMANGRPANPGIYAMLSLEDFKTYSVDYALESETNGRNVDIKLYVFGGSAVLRFYSVYGSTATATKNNEYIGKNGSAADIVTQNATKLLKVTGLDFETATAASIEAALPLGNITGDNINPFVVGDVIAFKTATTSTCGGDRIGLIKVLSNTQADPNNVTTRIIKVAIKMLNE